MPSRKHKISNFFESHFDRSPNVIKDMYCHLTKVFVEMISSGTAYASPVTDPNGKMTGAVVGIRKEVLDNLNQLFDCRWEQDEQGNEHLVGSCTPASNS